MLDKCGKALTKDKTLHGTTDIPFASTTFNAAVSKSASGLPPIKEGGHLPLARTLSRILIVRISTQRWMMTLTCLLCMNEMSRCGFDRLLKRCFLFRPLAPVQNERVFTQLSHPLDTETSVVETRTFPTIVYCLPLGCRSIKGVRKSATTFSLPPFGPPPMHLNSS